MRVATWLPLLLTLAAIHFYRNWNDLPPVYPGDIVALAAIGLGLLWLNRSREVDAAKGEQLRQGFAFRAGQALKRIRGGSGR
jgi:hypothetical protein